jgi:hypothetical protein
MQTENVLVRKDGIALLRCPQCETSKAVNVKRFQNRKEPLNVRCTCCPSVFRVFLESRGPERKDTYLEGYYEKLPGLKDWRKMLAKNISLRVIGFVSLTTPNIKEGDRIRIILSSDNASYADTDKTATVRIVKENYVGCEFTDRIRFDDGWTFFLLT